MENKKRKTKKRMTGRCEEMEYNEEIYILKRKAQDRDAWEKQLNVHWTPAGDESMERWMDGWMDVEPMFAYVPACLAAFLPASYYRHKEPTVTVAMSFSQSKMDRARV